LAQYEVCFFYIRSRTNIQTEAYWYPERSTLYV